MLQMIKTIKDSDEGNAFIHNVNSCVWHKPENKINVLCYTLVQLN